MPIDSGDLQGFNEVLSAMKALPRRVFPLAQKVFRAYSVNLQREMVRQTKGGAVNTRSGQLSRGWQTEVGGWDLKTLFASVSNFVPYAAIHEFGGTITAKSGKFLAIPLDAMKTASGVAKMSCRQAIQTMNTFFHRSKGGKLILFENRLRTGKGNYRSGEKAMPIPLFLLVKSVKIPKRLSFREQASKFAMDALAQLKELIA